ncbi:ASPIC/UnbV domain-containing protein [Actinomadura sp. NEAU-AAG7]|uniref:ASPIC/UnbV domain-containing protein n=1 Tax=Actinomadura sp. NEAU-AAG7 TaxID=2839640 RepID=UPI001BE4A168|nr:ASPIC/UnbV domain-containing protein [Actinomadura sp. NEAU-AAG7]MBT2212760.1 ASPIC/UnbV domain-containing protein [Actinomadura sp. NEAU-AAG7]
MTAVRGWVPGFVVVLVVVVMFAAVGPPSVPASERDAIAGRYAFAPMSIELPGGYRQQAIRRVNRDYADIDAWISSVGAAIAMNDMDGDGLPNDLCVTDPRIDQVVVTPVPGARAGRYAAFALNPAPLPMNEVMAPMGCVPGDFNEDGRIDLLVYLWGRTPIVYLARPGAKAPAAAAYTPVELVPNAGGARYTGPQWNSTTAAVDDFDGDGHDDIYIGDYFPDGPVLDDRVGGGVAMNRSLSNASNGGDDHFFRWTGASRGVTYEEQGGVLPRDVSRGWVLAAGANDLDGDQLPELYLAQDHGRDSLLYNRSVPGAIRFSRVTGARGPMVPKSKRIGTDSFKGMGIDFADLDHNGLYDMFVSNITTTFGLQESNLQFMATARDQADLRARLRRGDAPWKDRSTGEGTAWAGWGWDVKMADFDNSGDPAIVQATGFVKGEVNRWAQLQELATANDGLLEHERWWPHVRAGDDIAGNQPLRFFARREGGGYADVAGPLGLAVRVPTRGIATGDADGDGRVDMAVARQWDEPVYYRNVSPSGGAWLTLALTRDAASPATGAPGSPATGAQVTATASDGRVQLARVDGGSGHSGKRSSEIHLGLGRAAGPVRVRLRWRDRTGRVRTQDLRLAPGRHEIGLGTRATER